MIRIVEEIWVEEEQRYVPRSSLPFPNFGGDTSYGLVGVPLSEVLFSRDFDTLAARHTGATPDVWRGE